MLFGVAGNEYKDYLLRLDLIEKNLSVTGRNDVD
jgi:hypothetical protein